MKDCSGSLQHCALLFGMPVSREEFDRACARTPRSDYIAHLVGEDPEGAWNSGYAEVVSAAQELMETAGHSRAVIYREATLADFARATERATVVILLAHFRGFDFSEEDFLVPPHRIVAAIDNRLYPALAYFDPAPREAGPLVEALNSAVMERRLLDYLPPSLADAGRLSVPTGRVLCRDVLDEALAGLIRPGNQVDLFDGLHTPGEVEAALWHGFNGQLDLALCNSAALATMIDLRRHNRVHHLYWPDLIHPIPQLVLIRETLSRISCQGGSYIETRLKLEQEMLGVDWSKQ